MVARSLWRSEALMAMPWLRPCTRLHFVPEAGRGHEDQSVHYGLRALIDSRGPFAPPISNMRL